MSESIHDLRAKAQALGIVDWGQLDHKQLKQKIDLATGVSVAKRPDPLPRAEYDARLMTMEPGQVADKDSVLEILKRYIDRGLKVTFPDAESWHMAYNNRESTGTIRMPLRDVLWCAEQIMA